MFKLKEGSQVFQPLGANPTDYERGLVLIAQEIKSMIRYQYYISRLMAKAPLRVNIKRVADNIEEWQLLETMYVFSISTAIGVRKLIESNQDSWNFAKLFKIIKKHINTKKVVEIEEKLEDFSNRWAEFKQYGNTRGAHIGSGESPTSLPLIVNLEHVLLDAVNLLDEFVEGKIPYTIDLKEKTIDLREFIQEWSRQAPRIGPGHIPRVIDITKLVEE